MLSMIGAVISGTFMLLLKAIAIIGTGFLLSIGFFAGSLAAVKALGTFGKKSKEGENGSQPKAPHPTAQSN